MSPSHISIKLFVCSVSLFERSKSRLSRAFYLSTMIQWIREPISRSDVFAAIKTIASFLLHRFALRFGICSVIETFTMRQP